MSSPVPWILGGLGFGALVVWWRNRAAEASGSAPGGDACDALGVVPGYGTAAVIACKAARAIAPGVVSWYTGDLSAADVAELDATNRAINGEVDLPLDAARKRITEHDVIFADVPPGTGADGFGAKGLLGSVLRFKNGCVPFRNAAGWDMCGEGTEDMFHTDRLDHFDGPGLPGLMGGELALPRSDFKTYIDGSISGDNETHTVIVPGPQGGMSIPVTTSLPHPIPDPMTGGPFAASLFGGSPPIPIPAGESLYIRRGVWFTCKGEPLWGSTDHRSGESVPLCSGSGFGAEGDPNLGGRVSGGATGHAEWSGPSDVPDGYVWVVDHYERKKAG